LATKLGEVFQSRFGRRNRPSIWCLLLPPFRHDWQPVGGIPFRGKEGITPQGVQCLWCVDCHGEKYVWPWGDWKPEPGETFGYSGTSRRYPR
jgi:hypothetical protein